MTYFGRHADIAIHDDGRLVVSLAGPNRGGVTVAELALADEVDGVIERTGGAALPRII